MISCSFGASRQLSFAATQLARTVIKLQARVSQGAGNRKRRPDRAQDDSFRGGAGDDETADERVFARFHFQARGDISESRRAGDDEDIVVVRRDPNLSSVPPPGR